ncbi:MAG: hypothetical protein HYX48_05660 [Chlamydiales bacterium]|nr:hypothetical protein [Chlamydiales bacterium]
MLAYLHAKWVSYQYDIPLLYKPFTYSDQLALHDVEQLYSKDTKRKFAKSKLLGPPIEINKYDPLSTLYILPYFPESLNDRIADPRYMYIPIDWKEEKFHALLKQLVKPRSPLPTLNFPSNCITVAVHVRRGGGFDVANIQRTQPLRFPPDRFYIDQIRYLYEYFQGQPLYVYLFTDDRSPETIARSFQQGLRGLDIRFDYRRQGNRHNSNVVEDFFAMMQFDCLIRPQSNYSIVAEIVGDFKAVIYPLHYHLEAGWPVIDQIEVYHKPEIQEKTG